MEAGAVMQDMELVQFHPTGMVTPEHMSGRLVSEAVRGEGGHLLNKDKERFMENYSPEKMELDARDVVARAIFREIEAGRGTENGGVWLDISHKEADYIKERLPKLVNRFDEEGIDFTKEPVEVAPTSHYAMGGLRINFETGQTTVSGLFAVGEATAGVHGANRLGGNSLAETVVFGQIIGSYLNREVNSFPKVELGEELIKEGFEKTASTVHRLSSRNIEELTKEIRDLLWKHAGIIRKKESLEKGLEKLRELTELKASSEAKDLSLDTEVWEKACNLSFIMLAAEATLKGALLREESRGAHYREDADETKDEWKRNIYYVRKDGELKLFTEPVPEIPEEIQKALEEEHSLDYHHLE